MILKSYILEKSVNDLSNYKTSLFYGENEGLKKNFRDLIKKSKKEAEIINLFQEEIIKDESKLFIELNNPSLFSSKKIFFIQEASEKIYKIVEKILAQDIYDCRINIFCSNLDKKSKLRNLFEKDEKLSITPCYIDNSQTLNYYIRNKLKNLDGLTPEIINLIINNSSNKREVVDNEINKILVYFQNKKIEAENLKQLLNIKFDSVFEELRDAIFVGNLSKIDGLISETQFLNENNQYYINQLYQRINKLSEILEANKEIKNIEDSVESLKPKVFWKDKPQFVSQAKKVNLNILKEIMEDVSDTELIMKKNSYIKNDILVKKLIVTIGTKISNYA